MPCPYQVEPIRLQLDELCNRWERRHPVCNERAARTRLRRHSSPETVMTKPKLLLLALMICCCAYSTRAQTDWSKVEIKVIKVSGNVYMLEGAGGNIGVSVGPDGILI